VSESVTVIPARLGNDANGDPYPQGAPVALSPLEIAPGNALLRYGIGGDLIDVAFTVFFPLRVQTKAGYADAETVIRNGDEIVVRGRKCLAAVEVWRSQRSSTRGGVVVLARAVSGKAA
jgi:hypothetical protein